MRKIIATEYLTLDGVMEDPGSGGWSFPFWNDEAAKFKYDELFASDALLLGRVTYEGFAKAWPTMEGTGEFGEKMNSMRKYVVTTTLEKLEWNNTKQINQNIPDEVARLKGLPGKDILIAGSADLVNRLMSYDLIDEYRLMVHPVVLGKGKRFFRDGSSIPVLKLMGVKTFSTGIVVLSYEPERKKG